MRVNLLKSFSLSLFSTVFLLLSTLPPSQQAYAQETTPLRDSSSVRRKVLRRLSKTLKRGKRALKKNPCRAQDAFETILRAQKQLPNQVSSWRRRNRRSFLRSIRGLARQAKRYNKRIGKTCEFQKRLEGHQTQVGQLMRLQSAKDSCAAYQQLAEATNKLNQGPGFSMKRLPRAWRRSYIKWNKRQKRWIARKKGKQLRACRREWRRLYGRGKLAKACKKLWRPRSRRQRGALWIGVDTAAMLFINDEACGVTPIRSPLKTGRYLIRLTSPTGRFPEQSFTVRVKRGDPTLLLFHPMRDGVAGMGVTRRPDTRMDGNPPIERRDPIQPNNIEDPPVRRRTTARDFPVIRTRRQPPDDRQDLPPDRPNKPFTPSTTLEAPLWVGLGARFFSRTLYYNDDIFGELSPYNLLMAPALALQLHWFPGAHFTKGPLAHIGLVAEFSYALGLQSRTPDAKTLPTTAYQLHAGLRGRFPLGPVSLMLTVGYALHSFQVDTKNSANESGLEIPGVDYHALRIEGRAYWAVHPRIGLFLGAAYRVILGAGEIATDAYFPRIWIGQVDAEAGLDINILRWFAIRTRFQFNHYFSSMNSQPGDRRVAGGAVDQYTNIDLFLVFRL